MPIPKGPKGEKRPADVIGAAVMVGKIATGEIEDTTSKVIGAAVMVGKIATGEIEDTTSKVPQPR